MKVTKSVKEILNKYDANDLLSTIPCNYNIHEAVINIYSKKIKDTITVSNQELELSEQNQQLLQSFADNLNTTKSLVFNFLIETVADCGKVNTKNIKHALDCYYYAINHDRSLFLQILNKYAESGFYYTEETKESPNPGLNEAGIAYFLATSSERTRIS